MARRKLATFKTKLHRDTKWSNATWRKILGLVKDYFAASMGGLCASSKQNSHSDRAGHRRQGDRRHILCTRGGCFIVVLFDTVIAVIFVAVVAMIFVTVIVRARRYNVGRDSAS